MHLGDAWRCQPLSLGSICTQQHQASHIPALCYPAQRCQRSLTFQNSPLFPGPLLGPKIFFLFKALLISLFAWINAVTETGPASSVGCWEASLHQFNAQTPHLWSLPNHIWNLPNHIRRGGSFSIFYTLH